MAAPTRLCPHRARESLPPRALQLVQLPGSALGKRTPTNTPESQSIDVRTIWTFNPGAPPTSATVWVKEVGVHPAHAHQRRRPRPLSLPTRRQWLGDSTPFSFQDRVPPPPATLRPLLPARPHRARPQSGAYLGALAATRTRHHTPPLGPRVPGTRMLRRSPHAATLTRSPEALRVGASHRIYSQKELEGGADPVSRAAACAPRGGAEPSRAERSRAERGPSREDPSPTGRRREKPSGAEPRGALPSRAEPSREVPSARRAQRPESEQKGLA